MSEGVVENWVASDLGIVGSKAGQDSMIRLALPRRRRRPLEASEATQTRLLLDVHGHTKAPQDMKVSEETTRHRGHFVESSIVIWLTCCSGWSTRPKPQTSCSSNKCSGSKDSRAQKSEQHGEAR